INKKIVNSKPDIVTAPSQFVLDMHVFASFFEKSRKIVLPLGIELPNTLSGETKNKCIKVNILYVGQLRSSKGVQVLLNAFKQINYKNIKLNIVGGGEYESSLKKIAKGDERIIFYGKLPNEDVKKFYQEADITVVPSICFEIPL
ncbi:MAG: glycosyltransferase, partial [Candidatus Margulisbacteria bacterium]|nr:glycosyltransferase [Candidatus Margulisiibacteriota bacterium]